MAKLGIEIDAEYTGKSEVKAAANDIKQIGDAGKGAAPGIESAGKASSGLASTLKGLVGAGALLAAGKMMLDFGKASLMAASDVEEMQNKFDAVFQGLASDVTAELQTFADAANRSVYDLQRFAATLQDTFVPLGFARDKAADMSVQLVKLAEDMASFDNLPTQQVVEDLQSALVGNTETLRKYGIVATQAAIDQKALEMGLEFTKGKMDAQTKAAAILAITMESTADAQGDAIKTADGYANTSKGLEAAMMELKVTIGQELLPTMTEFTVKATSAVKVITEWVGPMSAINEGVKELSALLSPMGIMMATQNAIVGESAEEYKAAAMQVKELASGLEMTSAEMGAWTARATQATYATQEQKAAAEALAAEYEFTTAVIADNLAENERLGVSHEDIAAAEQRRIDIAAELAEKQRELAAASGDVFAATVQAEGAMGFFNETAAEMADGFVMVGGRTAEQNEELGRLNEGLEDLQGTYDKAADTIRDYEMGLKGINLTDEERNEKIAEQQTLMANAEAAMGNYAGAMVELNSVTGEAVARQGTMTVNQDAINQALFEAADAAGADATQLAILGGALGLYSEEAMEAALQTAIIQAKITELAAAYVAGEISVDQMRIQLRNFTDDLGGATGAAGELTGAIDGIERDITIHVGWDADPVPNLPGGGGPVSVGSGGGGNPIAMQSGGIVPGSFAQAVPITAHGSEMILNPTQQAALFGMLNGGGQGGMGQGITIQIINQGVTGENVAAKTQQGVLGAMRQVGQY